LIKVSREYIKFQTLKIYQNTKRIILILKWMVKTTKDRIY
jgi:hypothetical protein